MVTNENFLKVWRGPTSSGESPWGYFSTQTADLVWCETFFSCSLLHFKRALDPFDFISPLEYLQLFNILIFIQALKIICYEQVIVCGKKTGQWKHIYCRLLPHSSNGWNLQTTIGLRRLRHPVWTPSSTRFPFSVIFPLSQISGFRSLLPFPSRLLALLCCPM